MFNPFRYTLCCATIALGLGNPSPMHAQQDSSSSAHTSWTEDLAAWGSVGLGPGSIGVTPSPLAGALRANVSAGPFIATFRTSDVGPFFASGDGVSEQSFLAGVRSRGHRLFAAGVVGYSSASPYHSGGFDQSPTHSSAEGSLAYEGSVHANYMGLGIALSAFGDIGSTRASYTAMTLSVELGMFGR